MQTSSIRRPENLDKILVGVALFGFAFLLYFLINDSWMHQRKEDGSRTKIGSVVELSLDVRRRSKDEFIWLPIEKTLPVFEGDSIFTGSKSHTTIKLDSGVRLVVDPDSLIVLEQTADAMKLDLKFGQLRGSLDDKKAGLLKITVNNNDMALAGKSVEFAMEKVKTKETKLKVTKGTAQLLDVKSNKKIEVNQNQQIRLTQAPTGTVQQPVAVETSMDFINLSRWAMPRNLWLPQRQALKFSWETEGPVDAYEFTLSESADLTKPLVKELVRRPAYVWTPTDDSGKIFWQVKALNRAKKQSIESEVIQWSYTLQTPPHWTNLQEPILISKLDLKGIDSQKPLEYFVSWDAPLKTAQFRLEWARNAKFIDAQSSEFMDHRWRIPKWDTGQYFLRVRSESIGRPPSLWSRPLVVTITDQDSEGLIPPALAVTELETEANKGIAKIDWKPQEKAVDYVIEVADAEDFANLLKTTQLKKSPWSSESLPQGSYFVRVVPLSEKGRRGPASKIIKWVSRSSGPQWLLEQKKIDVEIPRDSANHLMAFPDTIVQWKEMGSQKATLYYLEQDRSPDFKNKQTNKISANQMVLKNLDAGDYYYRLRSYYADGTFSVPSEPLHLHVTEKTAIGVPQPVMITKTLESSLNLEDQSMVKLKWKKMKEAVQFVVQMSETEDFKNLLIEKKADLQQIDLSVQKIGTYFLRVAGISKKEEQGPWSEIVPWKVSMGAPLLNPMSNVLIEVESSESAVPLTPLLISWKAHKSLTDFQLQIAEDDEFKNVVYNERVNGNEYRYNLTKGGKYRIRVKGIDPGGSELTSFSAMESMSFIMKRPLIAPHLLFPKNKTSYVLAKMKTSELWLAWENKDKGSTSYQVEFSKDSEFSEVTYTRKTNEPRLLLDQKIIKGKIYWRVKAINDDQQLSSNWSEVWSMAVVDVMSED
ncbi:MAG: hypothetical protein RJB66_2666 [Pseudomonadota bacterium]